MNKILHLILTFLVAALLIQVELFAVASDTIFVKDGKFNVNNTGGSQLTISEGKEIVFKWINGTHDVTSTNTPAAWEKFDMNSTSPQIKVLNLSAGNYSFKCSIHPAMTGTITVSTVNSTYESKAKYELSIVPDYYDHQITFNVNSGNKNLRGIKVFDIIGKEVAFVDLANRAGNSSYTVNFSNLRPGIYMCSIYSDKGIVETRRFVWN